MLRRARRLLAGLLAALVVAPAVAVGTASVAQADPVRGQELWVLNAINVQPAWQTTMGHGVTIGLIDSGVNGHVSDLAGSVTPGRNFTGVNTRPSNPHWGVHGTWMASLIAGHGNPAGSPNGIIGAAPEARILSVRAVTDQGDPGDPRYQHESEAHVQGQLAAAIDYAVGHHVQVISMSLGYQGASLPVRVAIKAAVAKGVVVVASSGNSGGERSSHRNAPYSFPANYPGVLGVAAVRRGGTPAHFSSNNLSVQVAAPGVKVPAQGRDGQYWLVSGTSPACALTAGVAALIKSRYPAMPPALVVQAITASTWHQPHGGYNEEVGFGIVDAAAALRMAGRLVHDNRAAPGLAVTSHFGGGASAVPPVPVAPRGKRQLIIDIMLALACLALLAASAFWLIMTRGRAARPAWPGPAQPASGPPVFTWQVSGPPAPGGPVSGPPASVGPVSGPPASVGPGPGPPDSGPLPGGYSSPASYPPPAGYEPPADYEALANYEESSGYGESSGYEPGAEQPPFSAGDSRPPGQW